MGLDLRLRKMLTGDVNRLRYITRYSTSFVQHRENVAEHSYYVALYSMLIAQCVNDDRVVEDRVDLAKVMSAALIHDLDEARTGDFQRPFKYSRPELKHLLDDAAKEEFEIVISSTRRNSHYYVKGMLHRWEHAKDDTDEGAIVAFADYLSVLSHLWTEVHSGNMMVLDHYESLREYSLNFRTIKYDFLRLLVRDAEGMLIEICRKAGLLLE